MAWNDPGINTRNWVDSAQDWKIWICVLIIIATESIYYNYFRGSFVFIIIFLILTLVFINLTQTNIIFLNKVTLFKSIGIKII